MLASIGRRGYFAETSLAYPTMRRACPGELSAIFTVNVSFDTHIPRYRGAFRHLSFLAVWLELDGAYVQLKQVHYFLAICKDKSFTRAAKRCGVTQPTITAGIRRLEARLGADLFVRKPTLELTSFGLAMRPAMEQLGQKYESLLRDAKTFAARK